MGMLWRFANLLRSRKVAREIDAELQSHIALRIDDNLAAGLSPAEARRDALLRFGNPASTRERVTAVDTAPGLAEIGRDFRYAARQLGRSPGFAITAILTLALGIGANVVVFGVVNSLILRPLNVANADRLFEIVQKQQGSDNQSYPDFVAYRARSTAFSDMAAYRIGTAALSTGGSAQEAWDFEVSGNYFDMLGIEPELGRLFHPSDEHGPNSASYVVLSDSLWRTRFNADPRVIGASVDLNKHPFTIIGVAPKTFHGTELFFWPEFWVPMVNEEQVEGYSFLAQRKDRGIFLLGSLQPGVTPRQAEDNLNAIARQLAKEYPTWEDGLGARLAKPGLGGDTLAGPVRAFLTAIMLLALLVLVAACTNLAGVFAARASDRTRELAIRLSIGSTRWRILRQLLTEAILISVIGGAVGTFFAVLLLNALGRWQPIAEFPVHITAVADAHVYGIAFLLSLIGGILPGLLPARQVWRTDAMQAMKGSVIAPGLLRRLTMRDLLLAVQIAVCALLVTASLVSLRGMERSLHAPIGFTPQGAMLAETDMHMAGYSDESAFPIQQRLIEDFARIPSVTAVGSIASTPLQGMSNTVPVFREGATDLHPSKSVMPVHSFVVSPGYLQAAKTQLLSGRDFTWADGPNTPRVVLINQTFARKMFGNAPPVGRKFLGGDKALYEIVGVIEDGKYDSLTEEQSAAMLLPLAQSKTGNTTFVVRSQLPPAEVAAALNRALKSIDASLPLTLRPWSDALALVLFPARIATAALGVMGLMAAMLAVTGIFGMAAYTVSKRLRELSIRVALGARRTQLMRAALARPLFLLLSGSAAGLLLGVLASRLLAFLVYEATPRDPLVLLGSVMAMTLIGLIATWIPARRALAVNPAKLLREE